MSEATTIQYTIKYLGNRYGEDKSTKTIHVADVHVANMEAQNWVAELAANDVGMDGKKAYYEIWQNNEINSEFILDDNIICENQDDYMDSEDDEA